MGSTSRWAGIGAALVVACSDDGVPQDTTEGTGGGITITSAVETGGTIASSADGSGPFFDVGDSMGEAQGEAGTDMGCKKVDVVIAVDNSSSMTEEIAALQGPVFDSFPQTLLAVNDGLEDFHLGLIDACPKPAALQDEGEAGACGYSTGANYMVSSSPALAAEFSCATELPFMAGWSGGADECEDSLDDDEQPSLTAATVVSAPFVNMANAGFLRDDAVLMIVAITDEDEALVDANDVLAIYDMLLAAKGGDLDAIAFLGVAGGSDCDGAYGSANDATAAQGLAQLFADQGRGMFWDLCQGQLEVGFEMFIETIVDSACTSFEPPG